nr:hypothetical protein Iba_scaffold17083CG0010 [Ipomoea batatas]
MVALTAPSAANSVNTTVNLNGRKSNYLTPIVEREDNEELISATPPSTAQQDITLNFTGNLACEAIENGIQVNTTINLMCDTLSPGLQLGLAGVAMTQSGGIISGSVVLNLLQILTPLLSGDPRNLERSCFFSAPTEACADGGLVNTPNTFMMAPISVAPAGNLTALAISPAGPLMFAAKL